MDSIRHCFILYLFGDTLEFVCGCRSYVCCVIRFLVVWFGSLFLLSFQYLLLSGNFKRLHFVHQRKGHVVEIKRTNGLLDLFELVVWLV